MLPENHIFVKLTGKYWDSNQIKKKIISNICGLNAYTQEGILNLIKIGNFEIIYSNFVPTYAPCSICSESPIHLRHGVYNKDIKEVGMRLYLYEDMFEKSPRSSIFIWGDCVNIINSYFNNAVTLLGKKKFKNLYYKLFIFKHYENIVDDIYQEIGKKLFQILCL